MNEMDENQNKNSRKRKILEIDGDLHVFDSEKKATYEPCFVDINEKEQRNSEFNVKNKFYFIF